MSYIGRTKPTETTANVLRSTYTGDGSTTTYNLPGPVANETSIIATINGVTQQDAAYTTNGSQIIFSAAPALNDAIELRTISAVAMSYAPMDGSVVTGKIADLAVTTGKIADNSITTAKIAAGAVVQADLAANVASTGPAFSAYMSGTYQTISANTYTKVALNAELFDTNSNYDTTNYRFTPTVAGYYQINANLGLSYLTTVPNGLIVLIYKNGSAYLSIQTRVNSMYGNNSINQLVYMNGTTDYLELWGYSVGGTDPVFQGSQSSPIQYNSWFSGLLVRTA
jgi:hypothetical protein